MKAAGRSRTARRAIRQRQEDVLLLTHSVWVLVTSFVDKNMSRFTTHRSRHFPWAVHSVRGVSTAEPSSSAFATLSQKPAEAATAGLSWQPAPVPLPPGVKGAGDPALCRTSRAEWKSTKIAFDADSAQGFGICSTVLRS